MNRHTKNRLRERLFEADPHCRYCGRQLDRVQQTSLDHIVSKWHGGPDTAENVTLTCKGCNYRKGDWTPAEVLAWALRIVAAAGG